MNTVSKLVKKPLTAILLSIIMGFIIGAIILMVAGYNPLTAYRALFNGIFSRPKYIAMVIIRSTPIILTGVSVAFAFKTGLFNIGAEGQFIIGGITAAMVGYFWQLPAGLHFVVVILMAMLAAGLWGGLVGYLKARFGIHEVITSIMLNWVALYLNNFIITLPGVKKPNTESSFEALETAWCVILNKWKYTPEANAALSRYPFLAEMLQKTDLNYGILFAVGVAILAWFLLYRTTMGFEIRGVGHNRDAAEFAGINVKKNILMAMATAGAISGLAGALQITGVTSHRITTLAAMEGYGFDGISVALIAGSSPIGCIFSGLLFGALRYGGSSIQSEIGAPTEIINIMIGVIVFFVAIPALYSIIVDAISKKRGEKNVG